MLQILNVLWPEMLLVIVGCALLLVGVVQRVSARRYAPFIAVGSLAMIFIVLLWSGTTDSPSWDKWNTLFIYKFQEYVKLIAAGTGVLLVLLAWPTNDDATGNPAIQYGHETGEFFGLMLLSLAGIMFVASANDIILLFLGIELASIPTYIMVSISRPLPVAQEAGVKYFFLGAMAAAVMLFGFSYLYGTTGYTRLPDIAQAMHLSSPGHEWQLLAVIMLLVGFAFKIAAVPLHAYAGDVYQGAATPVTAFLAFVPKTSGFIAIIKVLYYVTASEGTHWAVPDSIAKLLWILAVLTMFVGNVLGLLQYNVKRVLAYSSIAHSGYMLVGITVLVTTHDPKIQSAALGGVLFYLAAYGIMNTGAFGVLMLIPSRENRFAGYLEPSPNGPEYPAATGSSAETFEDLAGQGRKHLWLGLAMAVCCWSLTGLPLTIGFFGKFFLIKPALSVATGAATGAVKSRMVWLVVLLVINAAISAAYYLKIIAAMFLRPEPATGPQLSLAAPSGRSAQGGLPDSRRSFVQTEIKCGCQRPIVAGIALSVFGTLAFGIYFPATSSLTDRAQTAQIDQGTMPTQRPAKAAVATR
jgi:NADH-quinone oxidoreductase subunit N